MGEAGTEDDILTVEYRAWRTDCAPVSDLISLEEVSQDEDGVKSMVFAIDSRKFQLRCPGNYPHYEDDNFFVEAPSSLQLWCNALNEYLLDSSGRYFSLTSDQMTTITLCRQILFGWLLSCLRDVVSTAVKTGKLS